MERNVANDSRVCQIPTGLVIREFEHQKPWPVIMAASLITILSISAVSNIIGLPLIHPEGPDRYDVLLLDVDQDGNLVRNVIYNTSSPSYSGLLCIVITELTTGGFAIAGCHTNNVEDSSRSNQTLWVIRTDENYNPVWNKTFGKTVAIRSITEMNNGDLAIAHYLEGHPDYEGEGQFQILVIDDEGEFVRERNWRFGWLSGFLHCNDGGFILAKEIYNTPDRAPFWVARIDTDLSVIWNKTHPGFAGGAILSIIEDIAGGFTVPTQNEAAPIGAIRLDSQGNEASRILTASNQSRWYCGITQCSNSDYLAWTFGYIIRFNIEGTILWEKNVGFYVQGIKELSPNRFVAFERSGFNPDWNSGLYLECLDASGVTIWTRSAWVSGFFVPDIIYNSDGGLTILGMVKSNHLPFVLHKFSSETPLDFDVGLLNVNQDGNLVQNVTYDTDFPIDSLPFWGKITELTTGGFAIAGFYIGEGESYDDKKLWVMRTDDDYNPVWNRTYGNTVEIRAITEMNNGDLAIGHYIKDYGYQVSTFQILVINDDGDYVREQSWNFGPGWCSGFSHCDDGGFILAKEIYNTPDASPYWIARIDTDLSVIWNKTYPDFATHTDILEDIAGGFTMPLPPAENYTTGIVRLDNQGNETSRVFINSTETGLWCWGCGGGYLALTQFSNGDYLVGSYGYIIRFNIKGEILWERYVDFYVHGFQELSPTRFVAFEAAGVRENSWGYSGVYLECFDVDGTTIWNRSIAAVGFFVPHIISNTDGGLTILGMIASNYLSSVLDDLSETTTEAIYYLAVLQFSRSLLWSDTRLNQSARVLRTEVQKMVTD
jgi:hypothetical protein